MSEQQIDSLTVGVGLTEEDFDAGVQKILRSLGQLRTETAATGESMSGSLKSVSSSVVGLGLKFAGLFIAVKSIEDVVGYFKNLSSEFSNLAVASEYLGQSGVELSRFGEVAKLAGGNAQDAISGVQGLQAAIFGLEFQGQMSQNLLMLQRLGVAYLDTAGHMRNIKDIAFDTARQLQQQLPGKANEALRVQWAATIFGSGGLANAIGGGLNELRTFYGTSAHDQKNITQQTLEAQRRLHQSLVSLSYEVKSEASVILSRLTPAIQDLINVIRNDVIPVIDEVIEDILHPISHFEKNHPMVGRTVGAFESFGRMLEEPFMRSRIEAGKIPDSVMSRIPSDIASNPSALDVLKIFHFEAGGDNDDPNWSKAITNYIGFYGDDTTRAAADYAQAVKEGRPGTIARPHTALPLHSLSTPGAARPALASPGAGGKPTASLGGPRVQIGSIGPIYTQARDANGLMAGIQRAAERKLLVAQADPGLA